MVNALTGVPIPRALVNMNSRAVLTDAQGRFSFAGFTDNGGYALVTKPGYSAGPTAEAPQEQKISNLDVPAELKLYPDAIVTGTITGPDDLPLSRVQVRLHRLVFDNNGSRWLSAGYSQTDTHGNFRFETSGGRYRVTTGYLFRSQEDHEFVSPVAFPSNPSSKNEMIELNAGEQRIVNLRPRVGLSYPVQVKVDGASADRGVRLTAIMGSGLTFQPFTRKEDDGYTTQLPVGAFTLRADVGERNESSGGEARVVVSSSGTSEVTIHLTPDPVFTIETAFEVVAPTNGTLVSATPSPQQFNLTLHNIANLGEGINQDARMSAQTDKTAEFRTQPGRYRLGGGLSGAWYIRSATCGVTNLMTEELLVAPGSAGSPIRLIVSNAVGRLRGKVTTDGQPAAGWVYLIPRQPSLLPYYEIYVQYDGSYQWSGAPGQYLVVPSSLQVREDFRDETFLHKFSTGGHEVQINAGADIIADLTLAAGVTR